MSSSERSKVLIASAGDSTIASPCKLNEVFSSSPNPVNFLKDSSNS